MLHSSLLGMSPFSLARPTKSSVYQQTPTPPLSKNTLPSPSFPPLSPAVYVGCGAGGLCQGTLGLSLACLMSLSTYSGLGEDGLCLGFLGRHHWTLLAISTETELLNTHTQTLLSPPCLQIRQICKSIQIFCQTEIPVKSKHKRTLCLRFLNIHIFDS